MNASSTQRIEITRVEVGRERHVEDVVTVEQPLEIRIGDQPLVVTMRTPGHDAELAAGFLWTEGVIHRTDDLLLVEYCLENAEGNVVRVRLTEDVAVDFEKRRRNFSATAACGICGKATLDALECNAETIHDAVHILRETIEALSGRMRSAQAAFTDTGGCHAAALFDASGTLLILREDVGRHNAVDKVVGWAVLTERLPLSGTILAVSGRAGFEIVQKTVMARIPVLVAVGAPSSLAVSAARRFQQTLIAFCRDGRFNVYHDPGRISGL